MIFTCSYHFRLLWMWTCCLTHVCQIGHCVWMSCAITFSLQILFCAVCLLILWQSLGITALLNLIDILLWKGAWCVVSLTIFRSLHSVNGFTACLCCLRCWFVVLTGFLFCELSLTIISIVIRVAFRKTRCLHIFLPCAPFDHSFVYPAYPVWKQPAYSRMNRQVKATPSLKPTQSLRSQSAIQVPQEEGCLLMCLNGMIGSKVWKKEILLLFPIDGNLNKRKEVVWFYSLLHCMP